MGSTPIELALLMNFLLSATWYQTHASYKIRDYPGGNFDDAENVPIIDPYRPISYLTN
jgi:hypothetical protein